MRFGRGVVVIHAPTNARGRADVDMELFQRARMSLPVTRKRRLCRTLATFRNLGPIAVSCHSFMVQINGLEQIGTWDDTRRPLSVVDTVEKALGSKIPVNQYAKTVVRLDAGGCDETWHVIR